MAGGLAVELQRSIGGYRQIACQSAIIASTAAGQLARLKIS
jgi:hypothetical protein